MALIEASLRKLEDLFLVDFHDGDVSLVVHLHNPIITGSRVRKSNQEHIQVQKSIILKSGLFLHTVLHMMGLVLLLLFPFSSMESTISVR